jgi:hypothetical protein
VTFSLYEFGEIELESIKDELYRRRVDKSDLLKIVNILLHFHPV